MPMPRIQLQQQREKRNHSILEQTNIGEEETKEKQRRRPYSKKTTHTELTQYIEAHPEMPDEMELFREDRKKMGELMLEYT